MGRRSLLIGTLLVALATAACQSPPAGSVSVAAVDPAAEAAKALSLGQYARAAELYRTLVTATPDVLSLRYGLAVAASHLDLKEEAIQEFGWVLQHGLPGSSQAETARRWLAAAGVLRSVAPRSEPMDETRRESRLASIEGLVLATQDGQTDAIQRRLKLMLIGLRGGLAAEHSFRELSDEQGRFRFMDVTPGTYMLTDAIAGEARWRLRLEVKPSENLILDLTPGNSSKVRDDFPERR